MIIIIFFKEPTNFLMVPQVGYMIWIGSIVIKIIIIIIMKIITATTIVITIIIINNCIKVSAGGNF